MPSLDEALPSMEAELRRRLGEAASRLHGESSFANLIESLLRQLTDANKADVAIQALTASGLDQAEPLAESQLDEIREAWSLAGLKINPKVAATVQKLAKWLVERHRGDFEGLTDVSTESIREELRQINGIGAATADVLLLQGLGRPAFAVDRAAYRIFLRHGWIELDADYDEARSIFERLAPEDPEGLHQWSQWLERIGKDFCKAGSPKCDRCPLREWLPESGPIDPS